MKAIASQITGVSVVYSIVVSDADQRKHLSSASLTVTGEFPAQKASNAENVSIWWRNHEQRNTSGNASQTDSRWF